MSTKNKFIALATFLNKELKGGYTPTEIIDNANVYYSEYMAEQETGSKSDTLEYLRSITVGIDFPVLCKNLI